MNILGSNPQPSLSILKDPFKSEHLTSVRLVWRKWREGAPPWISATVEFTNGDTKGEHEIKADSMDELIVKTKLFIETLKGK